MKQLLVAEDDLDIQELLENFLNAAGYGVTIAEDGAEALSLFQKQKFDLILLDIMMPNVDGYSVCRQIRKESNVPIVMLTALDQEENEIKAFDLQADDYITKPFSMEILLRKIAAILRRSSTSEKKSSISYRDITLDLYGYRAFVRGEPVELTQREFEVIRELLMNQGKVITRQMLLSNLWDYNYFGDERVVDTHIKNLRKKLNVDYIETIRGVGYRVEQEENISGKEGQEV